MNTEQRFSRLDMAFARFLAQRADLDKSQQVRFEMIVAELSNQQHQGHSCIRIDEKEQALLRASGMVSTEDTAPLILEQDRLYLHRYWQYETRLARQLQQMLKANDAVNIAAQNDNHDVIETVLDRYFVKRIDETDWQREAAKQALNQTLCIITGGPGTGKTSTVVKILALLQELSAQPLYIALAAPTGKAAMRLQESIADSKQPLPCSDAVKQLMPSSVSTLHRLLGARPPSPYFYHHAERPLPYDLVVVDEASMIDLALMSKLVDALKQDARLILLGDKDQLASVESGAVLADITSALPDQTLSLKKSYRFDEQIKSLAESVNRQQADTAWELLQTASTKVALLDGEPIDYIAKQQGEYLGLIKSGAGFDSIYQSFCAFQVLAANRHGKNSVTEINVRVEQQLADGNLISNSGLWYAGRPVMVTQNDPGMHLYNGDIGICLPDQQQSGKLMVYFQRPDGSVKKYLPARLPHSETVYAMTIHKSQGSEFDEVLIALPETINPVLTKELLYTAITRAKQSVRILANEDVFKQTIRHRVDRFGGLVEKLAGT